MMMAEMTALVKKLYKQALKSNLDVGCFQMLPGIVFFFLRIKVRQIPTDNTLLNSREL
uniref:Uncharacterized protein n=1 Tax=Anguilla anguilla TaxID=7936 RepID=A0A0E9USA5_ANGAN